MTEPPTITEEYLATLTPEQRARLRKALEDADKSEEARTDATDGRARLG
jgi:hypothetical protein